MHKQNLFLWALYDFANSIVYIAFLLYFAQWLVVDAGLSDFWYNALFALSTLLLLTTAPLLSARVDQHGGGKFWLTVATIGTALSYGGAIALAHSDTHFVWPAALLFLLGQYFYQLSFVFYTPMLVELGPPQVRARASGIGQFGNALGQICGVLLALPFAATRLGPMFPALLVFILLSLPMLLWYREQPRLAHFGEHRPYFKKLFTFLSSSLAASFLLAYFFFNDAVITLSNNYAIVLERMWGVQDVTKSLLLLAILIASAFGGIIAGWVAERIGVYKTLLSLILGWVVLLILLSLAPTFFVFSVLTVLVGLLIGSSFSTSRVYFTELLRSEELTYGFSLFTLFERFASFVGPLLWGVMVVESGYRLAVVAMAGLMAIGLVILLRYKNGWRKAHL